MRRHLLLILLAGSVAFLPGCKRSLPQAYGIYADTDRGQLPLRAQAVRVGGNMLRSVSGLDGPSGTECGSLQGFIVYQKDIQPESLGLVRLHFVKDAEVPGFGAMTRVTINMWLPQERIDFQVRPVEERRDMYILSPQKLLGKGFYALYIGSFGGDLGMDGHIYDIVVGSTKEFPSYAVTVRSAEEQFKSRAATLLAEMNEVLDRGDYGRLQDIYRPGGRVLAGAELQEFVNGNQTWLNSSGRILKSEITAASLIDEGASARCSVRTTYEKAGVQAESMVVTKIRDQYFITEIR